MDFNTSNVTIQQLLKLFFVAYVLHFNTSNVTIQRQYDLNGSGKVDYFNTSNVTIQLDFLTVFHHRKDISIHLMLLFNKLYQIDGYKNI